MYIYCTYNNVQQYSSFLHLNVFYLLVNIVVLIVVLLSFDTIKCVRFAFIRIPIHNIIIYRHMIKINSIYIYLKTANTRPNIWFRRRSQINNIIVFFFFKIIYRIVFYQSKINVQIKYFADGCEGMDPWIFTRNQ